MKMESLFVSNLEMMDRRIIILILVVIGIINGEYLRPRYGNLKHFNIIIGSLPNFVGAFVFSLFFSVQISQLYLKKRRLLIYLTSILVFISLTIEEYHPFFTASKTFDVFDIVASGLGVFCAIVVLELSRKKINES